MNEIYTQILQIGNYGLRKLLAGLHKGSSTPSISQNCWFQKMVPNYCVFQEVSLLLDI